MYLQLFGCAFFWGGFFLGSGFGGDLVLVFCCWRGLLEGVLEGFTRGDVEGFRHKGTKGRGAGQTHEIFDGKSKKSGISLI